MQFFVKSIVETVRHPLLILDAELRVVTANSPFYHSFGIQPGDALGRFVYELGPGWRDASELLVLLERIIPTGVTFEGFKLDHEFPSIGRRHLVLNARRVERDEDGTPMVLLAIEDETDKRLAQDNLSRLMVDLEHRVADRTADLAAANRELEAFCYSVSHDLRTPLRAIDGFSQELLIAYADKLDDRAHHYLTRVRQGALRMGALIDDLLRLSRVNRGEIHRERVDLTAVASAVARELGEAHPDRRVAFTAQPGLTAHGDTPLIRLALANLLGNAWKFTSRQPDAAVEFGQTESRGRRAFFVRDDGAGFDMRFAERLFGAFQRLHADEEFPGAGIGLATVQRVVHRHGGEVWAHGETGRGAAFYFTLPPAEVET